MSRSVGSTVTVLALLLGCPGLFADEARRPIYQAQVINQPGHYVLTRDLQVAQLPAISIQTDGVTVDLNGHTISSTATTGDVVAIAPPNPCQDAGVRIQNGRIRGGGVGIHLQPPNPCALRLLDLEVGGAAVQGILVEQAGPTEIRRAQIGGGTAPALQILFPAGSREAFTLSDLQLTGGCAGIQVVAGHGTISDSHITQTPPNPCLHPALDLQDVSGGLVQGNTIQISADTACTVVGMQALRSEAIQIRDNVIQVSSSQFASRYGIFLDAQSQDAQIVGNTVAGFCTAGIRVLSNHNRIAENMVNRNQFSGMQIGGENNLVEGNRMAGNGQYGIQFLNAQGPHIYRSNILRGNTQGAVGGTAGNTDAGGNVQ